MSSETLPERKHLVTRRYMDSELAKQARIYQAMLEQQDYVMRDIEKGFAHYRRSATSLLDLAAAMLTDCARALPSDHALHPVIENFIEGHRSTKADSN